MQRIFHWCHAFFWVVLAVFSWRYTKVFDVLMYDERISPTMLYLSAGLLISNALLFVYVAIISAIFSKSFSVDCILVVC